MSTTLATGPRPQRVPARRRLRVLAAAVLAALVVVPLAAPRGQAAAAVPPEVATATALPTWQTNGVVYAVEAVGDVVFVGGNFTSVRPPGAAAGTGEVARKNMAAFSATTGDLLPFRHAFTANDAPIPKNPDGTLKPYDKTCSPGTAPGTYTCDTVYEIRATPDHRSIVVGGDFIRVDGLDRRKLAKFDVASGALASWRVTGTNARVRALAVTSSTVFLGGFFSAVGGAARTRLAAVSTTTGALRPWAASADDEVLALALSPDGSRLIVGGKFDHINSTTIRGLAAVDTASGATARWDSRPIPWQDAGHYSFVTDLDVSGDTVYVAAEGLSTFDGRLAADVTTGAIRWIDGCFGATWAIQVFHGAVYSGSHAHDCSSIGAFSEQWLLVDPAVQRHFRLLAEPIDGAPVRLLPWFPSTDAGIVGKLGPRDMTATDRTLWVGGEFLQVNEKPQQGLVRFGLPSDGASSLAPSRIERPTATSYRSGEVELSWRAPEDRDDATVQYVVSRGRSYGSTKVATLAGPTLPWDRPAMHWTDTGLVPGSTWVYQVQGLDAAGHTSGRSWTATVTVSDGSSVVNGYLSAGATHVWRLGEHNGTRAGADLGSARKDGYGEIGSGVAVAAGGAVPGDPDPAMNFVGTPASAVVASRPGNSETGSYSYALWVRTTTPVGKLVSMTTNRWTVVGTNDRNLFLTSAGTPRAAMQQASGSPVGVTATRRVDDGAWHHLAVSYSGTTGQLALYVDGASQGSVAVPSRPAGSAAYWHVGGDTTALLPGQNQRYFKGSLDEFSVYATALSAARVRALAARTAPVAPAR